VTHSVVLRKRTEALFGVVTFRGFAVAGASEAESFFIPAVKVARADGARDSSRRIEFVGDSISCGYGIEGHPPCPFTAATENSGLCVCLQRTRGREVHGSHTFYLRGFPGPTARSSPRA
jgi:hypothetical protein